MSWISYDISFCHSQDCPSAKKCWRVQAQKEKDFPRFYSSTAFQHKGDKCDSFIDVKEIHGEKTRVHTKQQNKSSTKKTKSMVKRTLKGNEKC